MDYAYSPLPDHKKNLFYSIYRRMLPHRPNTVLIHKSGFTRVEDFLNHVKNDPDLSRPVGSLIIVSHGSDQGYIQMEIDTISHVDEGGNRIKGTTYEVLVNAIAKETIKIPDTLINPRPSGSPPIAVFHIRGCNVGSAQPFLMKFKAALGGNVQVSAPKVFDNNQEMVDGAFEYLSYNFKILSRNRIDDRKQLLNAFKNRVPKFTYIDGRTVPDAYWGIWIPKRTNIKRVGERKPTSPYRRFGREIEKQKKYRLPVMFRHNYPPGIGTYTFPLGGVTTKPATNAAGVQLLKTVLDQHPDFQPSHEFPEYKRYGYDSLQDFIDGYKWTFNLNKKESELTYIGKRHVYVVSPPVTDPTTCLLDPSTDLPDPTTCHLLYNYYPDNGDVATTFETITAFATAQPTLYQQLFEIV